MWKMSALVLMIVFSGFAAGEDLPPVSEKERMKEYQLILRLSFEGDCDAINKYLTAHPDVIKYEQNFNVPSMPQRSGNTLLFAAVDNNYPQAIGVLMAHGADATLVNTVHQTTPFTQAAQRGRMEVLREILKAGVDVNHQGWGTRETPSDLPKSALDEACQMGHVDAARLLLENGAAIESNPPEFHFSALHFAMYGYAEWSVLSVTQPMDKKTRKFPPPKVILPPKDNSAVIDLLLSHGADLSARTHYGDQPLHVAIQHHASFTVKYLLEHHRNKVPIDGVNGRGLTPLALAALLGSRSKTTDTQAEKDEPADMIVRLLLEHGADKNLKKSPGANQNVYPQTPYEIAIDNDDTDPRIIELLKP